MAPFERFIGRLTIRHLRLAVAIAEEKNLVRAAKRLNTTQSAVTKSLQEAEALLEVSLFDRTSRGTTPTIYGNALVAHARLVMAQLTRAAEEISDLRDGSGGHITVGTLISASADLLPKAIAKLRRERPKLVVSIMEGTHDVLMPALRLGELDVVVGRLPEFREREELLQEVLFTDVACVVVRAGHPLVRKGALGLQDLMGRDWILPTRGTTLRRQIDKAFRDVGVEPPLHAVESVSLLTNRRLLVDADYLGILPWQAARRDAEAGQIAVLPIVLQTTVNPVGMTIRANARLSPAADLLLRTLRVVAGELGPCPILSDIPTRYKKLK